MSIIYDFDYFEDFQYYLHNWENVNSIHFHHFNSHFGEMNGNENRRPRLTYPHRSQYIDARIKFSCTHWGRTIAYIIQVAKEHNVKYCFQKKPTLCWISDETFRKVSDVNQIVDRKTFNQSSDSASIRLHSNQYLIIDRLLTSLMPLQPIYNLANNWRPVSSQQEIKAL